MSLKEVSSSLMTCQKLYLEHYDSHGKKQTALFIQMMEHKMLEQEENQRNVSLQNQVARLESSVNKLWYQLRQKNTHEANLWRTYLAEKKKEIKALEENKILKLEIELMKVKNVNVFTNRIQQSWKIPSSRRISGH